jgi:hypothetical protein
MKIPRFWYFFKSVIPLPISIYDSPHFSKSSQPNLVVKFIIADVLLTRPSLNLHLSWTIGLSHIHWSLSGLNVFKFTNLTSILFSTLFSHIKTPPTVALSTRTFRARRFWSIKRITKIFNVFGPNQLFLRLLSIENILHWN